MGLAGRKSKQRIGVDPRNLTWIDDSSKFGAKYLQSLGWSTGSGLGASGEGRTSNLKIHQKLDLMGIGANRRGPGGDDAGWRGGREFEGLLARLNQAQNEDAQGAIPDVESTRTNSSECIAEKREEGRGPTKAHDQCLATGVELKEKREEESGKRRKRKRSVSDDDEDDIKVAKRKRKEERREKREKKKTDKAAKKHKKRQDPEHEVHANNLGVPDASATVVGTPIEIAPTVKVAPRYRAHRARNLASKRLAAASATGMNEILGISSPRSSEQTLGTSSITFFTQITPSRPPVWEAAADNAAPGLGLTRVQNRLEQADGTDAGQTSAMSLAMRSAKVGGLGFGGMKGDNDTINMEESSGQDLLHKSGKSVAEYFAEKMRLKNILKDKPASVESEELRRKKRKEAK